tara:strand:- start:541 stop:1545 length:1005 start_codon:yes stop_codon:yes gene_type:complete
MRYNNMIDMLPERAFKKKLFSKAPATLEGGGGKGDKPDQIQITPANARSGFGTATANPLTGEYSYDLDPRLAAIRDTFYGAADQFLPTEAQSVFSRGMIDDATNTYGAGTNFLNQAIGVDPQKVGQQYYNDIQALQAPNREFENSQLADSLFKTGRSGAGSSFAASGYINPEQYSLLSARSQADKQLAIDSQNYGRQQQQGDVNFGTALQSSGMGSYNTGQALRSQPYSQYGNILNQGFGIEKLGQVPMSMAMGGLQSQLLQQQQQQAYENATVDSGKGGLLGSVGQAADIALKLKSGGMMPSMSGKGGASPYGSTSTSVGGGGLGMFSAPGWK